MSMHELGARSGAPHGKQHRQEHERREPWSSTNVGGHAGAVRETPVAVHAGGNDVDLDSPAAELVDRIRDEASGEIVSVTRVRRGEDDDSQSSKTVYVPSR